MNKHFLNEEGITLTELLAALSLFAVVSALVMTVLFNVFQNSENISDNAQLRQDANLLVSTLRSHYNQGDFEVGLNNSNNSLLIGGQEVNSSMTSSIAKLELINGENSISTVNESKSMDVTADGTPLSINLTLENEAGQTYNLFTTIEKPAELEIALLPDPPDKPVKEEGSFLGETLPYCNPMPDSNNPPAPHIITKDTKYGYDGAYQLIPDACGDITFEKNLWISTVNPLNVVEMKHNKSKYIVKENLFVYSVFNIDNVHPMEVYGDALFNEKLTLKTLGKFIAKNIHARDEVEVGNYTRLEAKQSMVVAKRFHILSHGHAEIEENLFAKTVDAFNQSTLNIGENLIIEGNLKMSGTAEITVGGNARINGNLILGEDSKLTIIGNLTVTGAVEDNGNLVVTGEKNF